MPTLKPYHGPVRLVVAFDIGTTFSGISYCIFQPGQVPEVLGVTKFLGQPPVGADAKVPSLLYYDGGGNVTAAGAEVLMEDVFETALEREWTKAEWWKLHLRPKHSASIINMDDLPPLPPRKSAVDVLTDFISYLFRCTKAYVTERHPELTWSTIEHSIEYILTHPNDWEGVQQQLYRLAITRAGLIPATPEGQSRVHMLTEGEASLHYCVSYLVNRDTAKHAIPQGVAIIDAGGGFIDSSMFSVATDPMSCEEIAPAECRTQGSIFVTRRARALLQKKLEGWQHSTPSEVEEFAREFDQTTKLVIKSNQETAYIRVAGRRYNNPRYNISFGKLKLTGEEATSLFSASLDAIIDTFEQQQKSSRRPITMAFIIGGLSTNDWLWSQLQSYFRHQNILVFRPDNHVNKAVPHGAVLSRIDGHNLPVASRVPRATYGVICAIPAKANDPEHVRRKNAWEMDISGDYYVPDYFEAKIHRGTQVREETEFRDSFLLVERNLADFGIQTIHLMCYRGNLSRPSWVDQDPSAFFPFCTIRADLTEAAKDATPKKSASGQTHYHLEYEIIVFFGLTELKAQLAWIAKGAERRIPAKVSFEN